VTNQAVARASGAKQRGGIVQAVQERQWDDAEIRIGAKLKHARKLCGMTLREVAAEVGCSQSLISKIENDKAIPSLTILHRIVVALGTNISVLFENDGDDGGVVMRSGGRPVIATGSQGRGKGVSLERLIPDDPNRLLEANIHIVPPAAGTEGILQHDGEEMGYVLDGSLELTVNGRRHLLRKGDSFVFRSENTHSYRNASQILARILWINTPPTF
jgi:DNA-binding XRE family transcriptional regulator